MGHVNTLRRYFNVAEDGAYDYSKLCRDICISVRCRAVRDPDVVVKRLGDLNTDCRVQQWQAGEDVEIRNSATLLHIPT
jgi:hypothetical protein